METMAETMEQYMSKTRADYGSGVARPKIEDNDNFELKGQFLKELRTNTFSSLDHEDANEHIEKVLEIVDDGLKIKILNKYCPPAQTAKKMEEINNFQQELDENLYQAWEQFKELLMQCPQHYLTKTQEVILFYNGLGIPTRQILDSRAIQAQLNNRGREIKKVNEKSMLLKLDANNEKDSITPKIAHSKKKGKPPKKLTTRNLVDLFKEGDIEQQLLDSIKGIMLILRTKNEGNLWKIP
ncbi:putative reverse transcriptase domain-containing protein [Tanacetum coccineum]